MNAFAAEPTTTPAGLRGALPLVGLGFWQAWWMCLSSTDAVVGPVQRTPGTMIVVLLVTLAGYVLAAALAPRLAPYGTRRGLLPGSAACGVVGTVTLALATHFESALPVALFLEWGGAVLTAVFSALVLLMWGERWSTLAAGNVGRQLVYSFVLAFLLFFGARSLPQPLACVAVAAMAPVSAVALRMSRAEPCRTDTPVAALSVRPRSLGALAVALVAFSVAFGATQRLAFLQGSTPQAQALGMLAAGLLVGLFALVMIARGLMGDPFSFYRPIVPAVACGMALCLALPAGAAWLGNGVVIFGIYCLDMFIMFASCDLAYRMRRPVALVFGAAVVSTRLGTFLGSSLGSALAGSAAWGAGLRTSALACLLMMVVLAGTIVFTETDLRAVYQPDPRPAAPDLDERCAQVAREGGLSARELDVLRLLARGRSVAVIGETLGIAPGTVKHHASSIYRKLGVYDRQEVIDLVASDRAS